MRRINVLVTAAISAAVVFCMHGTVATQGNEVTTSRVSHIGVVVPDMDKALREFSRVMGFPAAKPTTYKIPLPDGSTAEFKNATLNMPNFFIELHEPVNAVGPYREHLQKYGMSIQHVGLAVSGTGPVDELRASWEQMGGKWVLGAKGAAYAYVHFPTLGTSLELNRGTAAGPGAPALPAAQASDPLPPLAALPVSHVGFAAADTAAVGGSFAKVLGVPAPKVNEYKDSQYPPDAKWNGSAYLRLSSWSQGGTGLELIESVGGPTPWSEFVARQKGTAPQHIAINVGNRMDEMIKDLQAKGGKWTNGRPGGGYAYLDFMDSLGLIFEINGTSKSAAPAK